MPLTFIVGVYGMNFKFMPELEWKYGYFAIMLLMFALLLGMIYYFKKKKWY
jgi:magnesium transporter